MTKLNSSVSARMSELSMAFRRLTCLLTAWWSCLVTGYLTLALFGTVGS